MKNCTRFPRLCLVTAPILILATVPPVVSGNGTATGEIRGKITITKKDAGMASHRNHALLNRYVTEPAGALAASIQRKSKPYTLGETAVVYLEGEGFSGMRFDVPPDHAVLDQRGIMFRPHVLPILVGTTVDFPNDDNLFHNVFSYSPVREFDLGRYPLGDSRSVTFRQPGIVRVYCDIHSDMNATILVLDNPYFATPDDDGNFVIHGVPEGKYALNLYYGRDVAMRRSVVVKGGDTLTVNLQQ